jgi:hypothetical protein
MAAVDSANALSPGFNWLNERVDKVQDTVELLVCGLEQRHDDGGIQAQ